MVFGIVTSTRQGAVLVECELTPQGSGQQPATRRARALWLVVPQLNSSTGPMVDGRPLHLTAPNQFVPVAEDWILTQSRSNTAAISTPESRNA